MVEFSCNVCDDDIEDPCILNVKDPKFVPEYCPFDNTTAPHWEVCGANKESKIEKIHTKLLYEKRREMVELIDSYGLYDFWNDYLEYLKEVKDCTSHNALRHFADAVISYHRITGDYIDSTAIKKRTITIANIKKIGGFNRYINDKDKLATTGFRLRDKLIEYSDCIRFDKEAVLQMKQRYKEIKSCYLKNM